MTPLAPALVVAAVVTTAVAVVVGRRLRLGMVDLAMLVLGVVAFYGVLGFVLMVVDVAERYPLPVPVP